MKLCTIVGARPQFIKAAAVSRALEQHPDINEIIVNTGQHYDSNMSTYFFDELNIPKPGYNLNIGSGSHGRQTGQMLATIEEVLIEETPDWVLVYGDTNSTLAGALAAAKLHIPVAHVEAGLRSFNRKMPEEINRVTTDHLSSILFAPTDMGFQQLLKEGIDAEKIHQVGDVMLDVTLYYNQHNEVRETIVEKLNLESKSYSLVTIHRAENTDSVSRLRNICNALNELGQSTEVIMPLHPRTRAVLEKNHLLEYLKQHVRIIDPVGYLDMLALEQHAEYIITDSGGVQKEAYFNQVPCITLRDETEWVELVDSGWNRLCSPESEFSLIELKRSSNDLTGLASQALYGKGDAAANILNALKR